MTVNCQHPRRRLPVTLLSVVALARCFPWAFTPAAPRRRTVVPCQAEAHTERGTWSCLSGVYCINLEHRPERWEFMSRQFEELQLPAIRWPAVDGRQLDVRKLVDSGELRSEALTRLLLPDDQKAFGIDLTPGALGCALSHMQVWIDIMQRNGRGELNADERSDIFLVVEDDCEFLPGFGEEALIARFAEVPEDWQLVFLGGVDAIGLQGLLQITPGVRRVYNGSRETTAYAMNVQGARAALEECFPLMWQLDTQLTLKGIPCQFNTELVYTTRPMSYIFWPPLVEQNKEDFRTDVQKDEHPRYLYSNDKTNYTVPLEIEPSPSGGELAERAELALFSQTRRLSLVGSWDRWKSFRELKSRGWPEGALWTEVEVEGGEVVEFQLVCNEDWNQRLFPTPQGDLMLGPSSAAHGNNWKLQVPVRSSVLHISWDPHGLSPLQYSFCESAEVSLARAYAITGSWNDWAAAVQLQRLGPPGSPSTVFEASVQVPGGRDLDFQLLCDGDWHQRMYPSPTGDKILGPNADGFGKTWRLAALPEPSLLLVQWDPTGKRSLHLRLPEREAGNASLSAAGAPLRPVYVRD